MLSNNDSQSTMSGTVRSRVKRICVKHSIHCVDHVQMCYNISIVGSIPHKVGKVKPGQRKLDQMDAKIIDVNCNDDPFQLLKIVATLTQISKRR